MLAQKKSSMLSEAKQTQEKSLCLFFLQERLVMSILPRFLVLEMIADMAPIDEYLLPQQFHKIYIHHYKDVRWANTVPLSKSDRNLKYEGTENGTLRNH